MSREKIDVLVVGAGPAGLCAAWKAASNDSSVLVIDKKKRVGEPVHCAEASFIPVLEIFDLHNGPWILNPYHNINVNYGGKKIAARAKKIGPVALDRIAMEKELENRAREEGAEIRMNCGLVSLSENSVLMGNGESVEPRVIIGADGVGSVVGRQSGIITALDVKDVGSSAQYLMEGDWDSKTMSIYIDREKTPGGYAWVFPKSQKRANVGIMVQGQKGRADSLLDLFLEEHFSETRKIERRGGCAPTAMPPESLVKKNVILAGDAGRLVFPFGAAGIHTALFSGSMAGEVAARALKGDKNLSEYDCIWKKCLLGQLERNYRLKERTFSANGLKRTVRMIRFGSAILNVLPVNPMNIWWGRMRKYVCFVEGN